MLDNKLKIKKLEQEIDYSLKLLESSNFEDEKQKIQYYINGLLYAKEIFKEKGQSKNE